MSPSLDPDPTLYLITDRHRCPEGRTLIETVEQSLASGLRMVQLREKDLPAAELWPLCQQLRALTRRYQAQLLINDRVDLALACDADGVHLGEHALPVEVARRLLGPSRLIGVSAHSPERILDAARSGADFCTFSPVYETPSKRAYGEPQGLDKLREACQASPLPVFALGGIRPDRITPVLQQGASGVALISAILAATDPAAATRQILAQLTRPGSG